MDSPRRIEGYDIVRELGRGAMGVVYLARDRLLDRDVAVKFLMDAGTEATAVERFIQEARATARLSHPNVVTLYRGGVVEGDPYLVMELLRGRSLEAVVAADGPLGPARLLGVAIDAARGLAAAHARGIVHRDVKPSNLFETDDGVVKVVDFGIAKMMAVPRTDGDPIATPGSGTLRDVPAFDETTDVSTDDGNRAARLVGAPASRPDDPRAGGPGDAHPASPAGVDSMAATRRAGSSRDSGERTQIGGTPLFMAPEVWREEGADHASDVFSLGATLFYLATGAAPFPGSSVAEIAFKILIETPAPPLGAKRPDLPTGLADAVDRALSKTRARRFASAGEMLAALERLSRESRAPRAIEGSPYPGLRSMNEGDRDRFFGREEDVARVIERLRVEPLVVLVGPSGAGKSSLAAAGVAPAVAEGALGAPATWRAVRVAPGRAPIGVLASALASLSGDDADELARELRDQPDALARRLRAHVKRGGEGILLLADQLEELVTLAAPDERDAAAAALGRLIDLAPSGVRVLATARSDLFDRLGALGGLGALLGRATELVRPLAGDMLREAIVGPARSIGARFEDESIVDGILRDVGAGEGALPLVAFAMRAWWDRRDRATHTLTTEGWRAVGGVAGALGGHAEQVYSGLAADDRAASRLVFLKLVNADATRRYATRAELGGVVGDAASLSRVLDAFAGARLVSVEGQGDGAQATIVHEALARAWPRFSAWHSEGQEDRALQERLRAAAATWQTAERPPDLLWRGAVLGALERWREVYDDLMGPVEREFAIASSGAERRGIRRRVVRVAVSLLVLGGVALGALIAAARAQGDARDARGALEAREARSRRGSARSARSLAHALREADPSAALAWLVRAADSAGSAGPEVRAAALAIAARGAAVRFDCTAPPSMPDGSTRFACAQGERVLVGDIERGRLLAIRAGSTVRQVTLAAQSDAVAWVDNLGALSVSTGGSPHAIAQGVSGRPAIALDARGRGVAVFERTTGRLRVLDAASGREALSVLDALPTPLRDRARVIAGPEVATVLARDDDGATLIRRFAVASTWAIAVGDAGIGDANPAGAAGAPAQSFRARVLALSGATAVLAEADQRVRVLDLDTGIEHACAPTVPGVAALALSPNGAFVAWVADPEGATPSVGMLELATCVRRDAPAPFAEGLGFTGDGSLVAFGRDAALRALDPRTLTWSAPIGPTGRAASPPRVLATGPGVLLLAGDEPGGAVWRGRTPWQAPLGVQGARVVSAAIARSRVVVADAADRVLVYGAPPALGASSARWLERAALASAGAPRVSALGGGRAGIAAPGLGAFVVDVPRGVVEWRAQASPSCVAVAGRYAMLAMPDGTGERVDFLRRIRSDGPLIEGALAATSLAVSSDGRLAAAATTGGPVTLRDLASDGWPVLPLRAYGELGGPSTIALGSGHMMIASRRLGFVGPAGVTTLADAPAAFYDFRVIDARFAPGGAVLVTDEGSGAWVARCDASTCSVERAAPEARARAMAPAGAGAMFALAPGRGLVVIDRTRGDIGPALGPDALDASGASAANAVALDLDADGIVLIGPPTDPFVIRLELPPSEPDEFAAWVAARTNVSIDAGEIVVGQPTAVLP